MPIRFISDGQPQQPTEGNTGSTKKEPRIKFLDILKTRLSESSTLPLPVPAQVAKFMISKESEPVRQMGEEITGLPQRGLRAAGTVASGLVEGKGLQPALQRGAEAVSTEFKPETTGETAADIGSSIADPRNLFANNLVGFAKKAGRTGIAKKEISKLFEAISGVDERNVVTLLDDPLKVLNAKDKEMAASAFAAAKKAAGLTEADERALSLGEGTRKKVYSDVMKKVDALLEQNKPMTPEQTGRRFLSPPVTMGKFKNDELAPLAKKAAARPSIVELLKAKKAGEAIANSDPAASGLIRKELKEKIDPLLQKMAPKLYQAQQDMHLALVLDSFKKILPRNQNDNVAILRLMGAAGFAGAAGIAGGPALLGLAVSPMVSGAALGAGALAAKSPTLRTAATGVAANMARQGFSAKDQNNNEAELLRVKSRLK